MTDQSISSSQPILQGSPTPSTSTDTVAATVGAVTTRPSVKRRFQNAARRVMNAQSFARQAKYTWQWQPGSDPGVDVHRAQTELYESSLTECKITIVDYCKEKVQVSPTLTNDDLEAYLRKPRGSWSKVRWINVEGLSYNVICTLALEFNLHPLAVEDILHIPQRTKVDRYPSALYASIILHAACPHEELNQVERTRSFLTEHMFGDQRTPRIKAVKDFEVTVEQASLFLLPNGTVLTFFQHEGELVCQPIFKRLQGDGTILRTSEDASLLVQAVLDAAVDHAFLVVNAYRNELFELEGNVLARPHAQLTKDLHLLTGELNQFKRTFMPTLALIRSLRENTVVDGADWHISNLARVYLSDVQDHCTVINDDLSDLITLADNLINLIFNLIASQTNSIMFVLSLVSCVFLPVTFIAGVYGTNFEVFPELKYSDGILYFWKVCGIVTALVIAIFALGFYLMNRRTSRYQPGREISRQLRQRSRH